MPEPLPEHIQCAKCAKIKPRKEFKKRLTPKQMKRYGKSCESGLLMTVLSKHCKACQPKRKALSKLPLHELKRIKTEGAELHRVSEYRLDALIEKASTKDVTANQSRSLKLRQQHAKEFHAETLNSVDAAIRRLRPRAAHKDLSDEKRAYFRLALEMAIRTREFIKADILAGRYDKGERQIKPLSELLTLKDREDLTHAYYQIPEQERQRMRRNAFT
jgi:Na+-translocating ferredoxin:NAD+ oxidoreductase RnfC subunit